MGKSQRSGKPFGFSAPLRIPLSGIPFSPSLLQAKDDLSINVRKILDTTMLFGKHNDFLQDVPLVFQHGKLVDTLTEMQIG